MQLLIDCNNFFASCEQLFEPKYRNRPLVVLSNNDGCVVARSKEAKELNIPMGAPAFEYKSLFIQHDVIALSGNFALYGDLSKRIMTVLDEFGFEMEIYSIDEAFLKIPKGIDVEELSWQIKKKIEKWIGIPISVGSAPTKTLAKIANRIAKSGNEVCVAYAPEELPLEDFPVEKVWGIGRQTQKKLATFGITKVGQFTRQGEAWVKKHFHITGLRTYLELGGMSCIPMESVQNHKSISHTRTFQPTIEDKADLLATLSAFAATACEKLRKYGLQASCISIFITTSRFKRESYYSNTAMMTLEEASAYTPDFLKKISEGLNAIYKDGFAYKRVGVLIFNFTSPHPSQKDAFFKKNTDTQKQETLMKLTDSINKIFYKGAVRFASEKPRHLKITKRPRYTTNWDEIPTIHLLPNDLNK